MKRCHFRKFFPFFLRTRQFASLFFPMIWSIINRKWPRRRSVAPELWWCPGIAVCTAMLRDAPKSWKIFPINRIYVSITKISCAPNAANQYEIIASRTISAVCYPFFLSPDKNATGNREKASGMRRKGARSSQSTKSIATIPMNVLDNGISATLPNIPPV